MHVTKSTSATRAVASASFTGSVEERLRVAIDAPASPDITHTRRVREGETLLQLAQEIYGNPRYYVELARANRLSNFRKLTTGQILTFPHIEKNSVN